MDEGTQRERAQGRGACLISVPEIGARGSVASTTCGPQHRGVLWADSDVVAAGRWTATILTVNFGHGPHFPSAADRCTQVSVYLEKNSTDCIFFIVES